MVLGLSLHREKKEETVDMETPAYANTAVNQVMTPRSPGERADRREKGIDIDMIDPEEVIRELEALAHYTRVIRTPMPYDDKGITKIAFQEETVVETRPWAVAALIYLNKVWPTIWMSSYEADTKKLVLRTAFYDIRKSMPQADKRKFGVILKAVENLCTARLEDTKEGHKPLLIKVNRNSLEVTTTKGLTNTKP